MSPQSKHILHSSPITCMKPLHISLFSINSGHNYYSGSGKSAVTIQHQGGEFQLNAKMLVNWQIVSSFISNGSTISLGILQCQSPPEDPKYSFLWCQEVRGPGVDIVAWDGQISSSSVNVTLLTPTRMDTAWATYISHFFSLGIANMKKSLFFLGGGLHPRLVEVCGPGIKPKPQQ